MKAPTVKPSHGPRQDVPPVLVLSGQYCLVRILYRISENNLSPTGSTVLSEGLGVILHSETCLNLRIKKINVQNSPTFTVSLAQRNINGNHTEHNNPQLLLEAPLLTNKAILAYRI